MFCISCGISSKYNSEKMCCKLNRLNATNCHVQNAHVISTTKLIEVVETEETNYEDEPLSPFTPPSSPTYNIDSD